MPQEHGPATSGLVRGLTSVSSHHPVDPCSIQVAATPAATESPPVTDPAPVAALCPATASTPVPVVTLPSASVAAALSLDIPLAVITSAPTVAAPPIVDPPPAIALPQSVIPPPVTTASPQPAAPLQALASAAPALVPHLEVVVRSEDRGLDLFSARPQSVSIHIHCHAAASLSPLGPPPLYLGSWDPWSSQHAPTLPAPTLPSPSYFPSSSFSTTYAPAPQSAPSGSHMVGVSRPDGWVYWERVAAPPWCGCQECAWNRWHMHGQVWR